MAKASIKTRDEIIRRNRFNIKNLQKRKKEKGVKLDSVCTSTGLSHDR